MPEKIPPRKAAAAWLAAFADALARRDFPAAAELFADDSYWRDLVAFTWNLNTAEGRGEIQKALAATVPEARPAKSKWKITEAAEADGVAEAWFTFETHRARGLGHLRLRDGQCWTLLTTMTEIKGCEEKRGPARESGVAHGAVRGRETWSERRARENAEFADGKKQPYCVIVGGGQGGIALAARLRRLEVPAVVLEKNARPGDSWRNRYRSLCLHDPVWYDHLPYLPFPDHWPVFSPKDKIGDWLESYARVMELNYWNSTECLGAEYDPGRKEWKVRARRDNGGEVVLRPKQLVMATGMSGVPNIPEIPGADRFGGKLVHSSQHQGGEGWGGKKALVLGSNNSAHDIAADLWEQGADVTMIQRSSTHIAKSETLMELALGGLYSESAVRGGISTNKADLIFASVPYAIMAGFHIPVYEEMARRDADLYARLEKAGFLLDWGDDGSGLFMKYLRRGSGYYIDVGASDLVANGDIKLRSGVNIARLREGSAVLTDGTELPADLIVLATGYGSMNGWAAKLISREVADRVGKCWGLGSGTTKDPGPWEGELRNMWKPTRQEGLWFHGGNLHQSRHYSQFLSLQIKARMEKLATPVYGLAEVHHLS